MIAPPRTNNNTGQNNHNHTHKHNHDDDDDDDDHHDHDDDHDDDHDIYPMVYHLVFLIASGEPWQLLESRAPNLPGRCCSATGTAAVGAGSNEDRDDLGIYFGSIYRFIFIS